MSNKSPAKFEIRCGLFALPFFLLGFCLLCLCLPGPGAYASGQRELADTAIGSDDSEARFSALEKITDQEELARVARESEDMHIRFAAVGRIEDEKIIAEIISGERSPLVRYSLVDRVENETVLAEIARRDSSSAIRRAATAKLTDEDVLAEIALEDAASSVRLAAVELIGDEEILSKVALEDEDERVRMQAVRKITDSEVLRKVSIQDSCPDIRFFAAVRDEWPMWRFDPSRSAETAHVLSEDLKLQWVRELPEPRRAWSHQWDSMGKLDFDVSFAPVAKGGRVFVPSNATDSVTAYNIEDGTEEWRFYADGPVRFAPAVYGGKVYFASDDGHLYCVDAETGGLEWKFRGGPSDLRLLGNERIINLWPARGGPVVCMDGKAYFSAGIWPMHGIFIYALDAESGDVVWVNDTTSSDYVRLPHGGAYGYGGLAPQGYLAVAGSSLVVAGGRTPPVFLNRETGEFLRGNLSARPGGNYAVHGVNGGGKGRNENEMLRDRVEAVADEIDGEVFYKLAARGRLIVSAEDGTLYCFGPDEVEAKHHAFSPSAVRPSTGDWTRAAEKILEDLGESRGYALLLGAGSGDLLRELLVQSELHVVVVEEEAEKVRALRDELAGGGLYGERAAVIEAAPSEFKVQPYLFSVVASEDAAKAGIGADSVVLGGVLELLRPYGGVAYLRGEPGNIRLMSEKAEAAAVEGVTVEAREPGRIARLMRREMPAHVYASREGPLPGAGEWTHQLHDAANTLLSEEERVRLPLGVLWFGGPNHDNILPRHSGGPRPQVAGGRQVFLGVETISARCVYTGRQLWEREFPGIGHPFTNMELERKWRGGEDVYMTNIPGATYIGSPFVTLPDSIYLRYEGRIHRLDPSTGETKDEFSLPGRSAEEIYGRGVPDWGHVSVNGDFLITTSEPHLFENQELGWTGSYSGTSSRRIAVMDRRTGEVAWQIEADTGFRHNAIISSAEVLYLIDGLSENAVENLARRGEKPEDASRIMALDLGTGRELWKTGSDVFGTFLLYSSEHDILLEGGSQDLRRRLGDEPRTITARRGADGGILWQGGRFTLPGALSGEKLIPGRPGEAISILTGEKWMREQPHTGKRRSWGYQRAYGCNTFNASRHLLLYRTGYAGYYDLEHDTGTGNFSGFRSGCTASMIPADGVLNALDYTRTCICSYAHQTSLAMVHMPGDYNIEFWTRYDGNFPDPSGHGINFGAPGRRVDENGVVWHDREGTRRRHPSAIKESREALKWVLSSGRETDSTEKIEIEDVRDGRYIVRLYFAELTEAAPGDRKFDVLLNGERVLEGFDIAAEGGGSFNGVVREFSAEARQSLELELRTSGGSGLPPFINGIELRAE